MPAGPGKQHRKLEALLSHVIFQSYNFGLSSMMYVFSLVSLLPYTHTYTGGMSTAWGNMPIRPGLQDPQIIFEGHRDQQLGFCMAHSACHEGLRVGEF